MESFQLVALTYQLIAVVVGFGLGWVFSSPFNKAKVYRLIGKPKKVVWFANTKGRIRDFLIDANVADEKVTIEVKPFLRPVSESFAVFPNSAFDGDFKTIPFGIFDSRDGRQIPLSQYSSFAVTEDGNTVWRTNYDLIGNLISPTKIQNILSTQGSSARLKARNETNLETKSLLNMVKIAVGASVIALIIIVYVAIQTNSSLNLIGELYKVNTAVAASAGNFTAT